MTSEISPVPPQALTLDALVAHLVKQEAISGILFMGTTGTAALTPTSDYDLLLVFAALPVPLRMVTTWVDDRLTEIYCTTVQAVERVATDPTSVADGSDEGILLTWLREGRVVHDRDQILMDAQARARQERRPIPGSATDMAEVRRGISYNVVQLHRHLGSDDPVSRVAVDLRLLYSLFEVVLHYFPLRHLPWHGEKAAVRYWQEHDPDYLALLQHYLAEGDRPRKAKLYEELAQWTLAPVGGLWERGATTIATGAAWGAEPEPISSDASDQAMHFWQNLIQDA